MKKILISVFSIAVVGLVAFGATQAFFSDTETSKDNVLQAGAIDLGIDNESFYNGILNRETTWIKQYDMEECLTDTEGPCLFFNFLDLKPGDYGEDTISLNVKGNESWMCVDVTLTADDDVDCTEPELDDEGLAGCNDPDGDLADGELGDYVEFLWWADDGDNVLEDDEKTIHSGVLLGNLGVGSSATVALADSQNNIWNPGPSPSPFPGDQTTKYIGKAFCFGDIGQDPLAQDGEINDWDPSEDNDGNGTAGEPEDGGITCDGTGVVGNAAQTDKLMADISFRAIQARHNDKFLCNPPVSPTPTPTPTPEPSPTGG